MDYCLHNLPEQIYGGSVCGNGFTEDGEDCDCGLPQVSSSSTFPLSLSLSLSLSGHFPGGPGLAGSRSTM